MIGNVVDVDGGGGGNYLVWIKYIPGNSMPGMLICGRAYKPGPVPQTGIP